MHGLVILDKDDQVIRPAILWNDGRTTEETDYLNNEIGKETLSKYTANIAFTGFTAPKILWVKKNEPENLQRSQRSCFQKIIWHTACQEASALIIRMHRHASDGCRTQMLVQRNDGHLRRNRRTASEAL